MRIYVRVSFCICCLASLLLAVSCRDNTATPQAFTANTLTTLGEVVCSFPEERCLQFQNLADFLDESVKKGFISEKTDYLRDDWGRELKRESRKTERGVFVRVLSAGKNGVFEDGGGDDIALQVIFDGAAKPQQRLIAP